MCLQCQSVDDQCSFGCKHLEEIAALRKQIAILEEEKNTAIRAGESNKNPNPANRAVDDIKTPQDFKTMGKPHPRIEGPRTLSDKSARIVFPEGHQLHHPRTSSAKSGAQNRNHDGNTSKSLHARHKRPRRHQGVQGCLFCSKTGHAAIACPEYSTADERMALARNRKWCFICLMRNHTTDNCSLKDKKRGACQFCRMPHNGSLCMEREAKWKPKESRTQQSAGKDSEASEKKAVSEEGTVGHSDKLLQVVVDHWSTEMENSDVDHEEIVKDDDEEIMLE
ncbi:hypothetical protein B9Z55_028979 [Caenorhabditis nigoni]|uniref:CCHC-type domain-containing protein n=1 Tax=Caenorhabditis nigoni TaxID=1611254 RepID=A0A2G5S934_9PELO|nr:hypothetical protein B9Z55_028977 [Caenorhabditis nigoni]PIC11604.1 hypothetical protein B9Z55_028979 [Caenorhabditis nigoni]